MKLLRTRDIVELTRLSRMTIYRMEKAGRFPARRQLGSHSVGWFESEVRAWIESRPRTRDPLEAPEPPPAAPTAPPRVSRNPGASTRRRVGEQTMLPLDVPAEPDRRLADPYVAERITDPRLPSR